MSSDLWKLLSDPSRLSIVGGPCAIESEDLCLRIAGSLRETCDQLGLPFVFKASFDKANRSSAGSFRGPGLRRGLRVLRKVGRSLGVPILTDVHTVEQVQAVAEVVDVLQIPAFLCRQTDLVEAAARTRKVVNIKKGQFLSPTEMELVVRKAEGAGSRRLLLTERGSTFGYNNLVVDMRSIPILRGYGYPVLFDATHSVQLPGAAGDRSGGDRRFAPILAQAAVAAGADGLFLETHPEPDQALSDGPNMIPLAEVSALLARLCRLRAALS